jgi:subtilase family serine protease
VKAKSTWGVRCLLVAAIAVLSMLIAAFAGAAHRSSAAGHAMQPALNGHPRFVQRVDRLANPNGAVLFGCQTTHPALCFGPDQIRVAYNVQPLLDEGIDGSGGTIVIVDAYGSPTLLNDLHTWDVTWGIPDPVVQVHTPFGIDPTSTANAFGWGVETSLDVQWAHAIAPKAKIALVVAKSNNDSDINAALKYAVDNNVGDVISMSFGEGETCMAPADRANMHATFEAAAKKNITLFASSGDQGSAQPACDGSDSFFLSTSIPATDPNVTSVGGTNLFADGTSGAYQSETTWNETALFGPAATGGGHSVLFGRPSYQAPVVKDAKSREVPDIAYNGGINGGVLVRAFCPADPTVCGAGTSVFFRVGGTSAGSPQWAGLIALTNQMAGGRVGDVNKTLYNLGKGNNASTYFHDITTGNNGLIDVGPGTGTPIAGFDAASGYDMATGWGSPIANALVPAIAKPGNG